MTKIPAVSTIQWPSGREHFVCTTFVESRWRKTIAAVVSLKSTVSETREGIAVCSIRRRHAICTDETSHARSYFRIKTTVQGVSAPGPTSVPTKRFIDDRNTEGTVLSRALGRSNARVAWLIALTYGNWSAYPSTRLFITLWNENQQLHAKVRIATFQSPDRLSCTSRRNFTCFDEVNFRGTKWDIAS